MKSVPGPDGTSKLSGLRKTGRVVAVGAAFVVASAVIGAFLLVTRRWQPDTQSNAATPESREVEVENVHKDYLSSMWQRQFVSGPRLEPAKRAEWVIEDIDSLQQAEIDAYAKLCREVKTSEAGKRLIEDEWPVAYFTDECGDRLPRQAVAKYWRGQLEELMPSLREAVDEPKTAYGVSRKTVQRLELIEYEVVLAKQEYSRHRQQLKGMVKMASEESNQSAKDVPSMGIVETLLKEGDERSGEGSTGESSEAERKSSNSISSSSDGDSHRDAVGTDEQPDH